MELSGRFEGCRNVGSSSRNVLGLCELFLAGEAFHAGSRPKLGNKDAELIVRRSS